MRILFSTACLALAGAGQVLAADPTTADPATPPAKAPPAKVTVSGTRANDTELRRESTASKLIFGREELDRNGDTSLADVLKRLPGVTIGGRPGRGGEIRMRGLGSGYTQILINGERAPMGFSMDSLSPDQVERIEVIRGPVAEHSTQAIAGTINIVLREGYQQKDIQLKLADNIEQGRHGPNVSLVMPGKRGALTYTLNATLLHNRRHDDSTTHNEDQLVTTGAVQKDQQLHDTSDGRTTGVHLSPRLSYRWDDGDTLVLQPFLMHMQSDGSSRSDLNQSIGPLPVEYDTLLGRSSNDMTFLRGFGNYMHRMAQGARLEVKFGGGFGKMDNDSDRNEFTAGALTHHLFDDSAVRDKSINTGGKYTNPVAKGHLLAAGWDLEAGHRTESRVSLDNGAPIFPDAGATLTADTRRLALYAQDEWDITPQWGVYLGLRWEGIRTTSSDISNTSSVWSPVLHAVWRIPGFERDQIRASYTRSYKAPALSDMIAAPSYSTLNSATRPDRIGNPNLKPELARGLDFAYEHYLGRSGIISIGGFARNIDNLIRRDIEVRDLGHGPRWVSVPTNIGNATTRGLELEAKFQLTELVPDGPNIDFRSNYSRFWSSVDGIPGPDNRLDQQPKQTANVGFDYRMKSLPLTLGASYNWTPAITVQTTTTEVDTTGLKRQVDLYGLWRFSSAAQLRISVANLYADDYLSGRTVTTNGVAQMADTAARTYRAFGLRLELKI